MDAVHCAFSDTLIICKYLLCKICVVNLGDGKTARGSRQPPEEPALASGVGRAPRRAEAGNGGLASDAPQRRPLCAQGLGFCALFSVRPHH